MASANLVDNVLTLETGRICRRYRWNGGNLVSIDISRPEADQRWTLDAGQTDLVLPGLDGPAEDAGLNVMVVPATRVAPRYLRAEVLFRLGDLWVRRVFHLYEDVPAIACDFYLKGAAPGSWTGVSTQPGALQNIETASLLKRHQVQSPIVERIAPLAAHLDLRCVRFLDITDRRNTLVEEQSRIPYRSHEPMTGNLLLIRDTFAGAALFVLKEAPCSDIQLARPPADFLCSREELLALGLGLDTTDLRPDEWVRGYGFVTGVAGDDDQSLLTALREYQGHVRPHDSSRDDMIMVNTWGDRNMETALSESFAIAELEAAARLGATHLQLDSGWQKGCAHAADGSGSLEGIWERDDYWDVRPETFPNGFEPVVARSRELGIELCLWFNPSRDDSYAHWRDDADALIRLYRRYGVRIFKIDGIDIPDKRADIRLRATFDRVLEATDNQVAFNLDLTAMRRGGYHYFNEYGTLFLENRYTDWSNYYPHWTLRNLWMLSRYVPPQAFQIEFLNVWRNADKYAADDPLAPHRVPFAYCFATTMMAQPLCWFEASRLPEEAFAIAELVRVYRSHMKQIHAGRIFPIGEEPSGRSWTGFQSVGDGEGYLLVFREHNDRPSADLELWGVKDCELSLELIAGIGEGGRVAVGESGGLNVELPAPFSFALYRYSAISDGARVRGRGRQPQETGARVPDKPRRGDREA